MQRFRAKLVTATLKVAPQPVHTGPNLFPGE